LKIRNLGGHIVAAHAADSGGLAGLLAIRRIQPATIVENYRWLMLADLLFFHCVISSVMARF
jgi:hypothetical protein